MKIVSRPNLVAEADDGSIGSGPNVLRLTDEQLEVVMTLLCYVLPNQGHVHSEAAFEILDMVELALGHDFIDKCTQKMDLYVKVEDDLGETVFESDDTMSVSIGVV